MPKIPTPTPAPKCALYCHLYNFHYVKKQTFSKASEAHHTCNTTNKGLQSLTCVHAKTMFLNSCLRVLLLSSILCPYLEKSLILSVPNYMVQVIITLLQQQLHSQSILLYFFERKTQHH